MSEAREELRQILRQDLTDFLVFFLFQKYLSSFRQEHIIAIANAVATTWAKRIHNSSAIINQAQMLDFMKEITGDNAMFNQTKKESDKIMQEEIESLRGMIKLIAEDSLYERSLIDTVSPETTKVRKPKKL
jgi:hypothetical protein